MFYDFPHHYRALQTARPHLLGVLDVKLSDTVRVDHHGDVFQTIDAKCVPAIATDGVLWLAQTIVECGIAVCEASHTAFAGRLAAAVVGTRARQRAHASLAHAIHRRPLRSHSEQTREREEWREII